jgi:hypothetical protein
VSVLSKTGYIELLNRRLQESESFYFKARFPFFILHSAPQRKLPYKRTPFQHPALEGLQNLTSIPLSEVLMKHRLAQLATSYGIAEVTRWKPRNVSPDSYLIVYLLEYADIALSASEFGRIRP